jgi:hypothetical protein
LACHGCNSGYVGYGSYFAYPNRARFGFHEYYGFYDSGYKASPGGGFHNVVGSQRFYGVGSAGVVREAHATNRRIRVRWSLNVAGAVRIAEALWRALT